MSIAQFADLIVCPEHIATAAKSSSLGLGVLTNQKAFLESFSTLDAAFLIGLNKHKTMERYFGFVPAGVNYTWGIKTDAESSQFRALLALADSAQIASQIDAQYLQPSPSDVVQSATEGASPAFSVEDLGNGVVVLIVKPGAIYAMRNDNYLMTVLRAVVERMFGFVPLANLLQLSCSSAELVKRYLNLAAFTNPHRPPQPVFG